MTRAMRTATDADVNAAIEEPRDRPERALGLKESLNGHGDHPPRQPSAPASPDTPDTEAGTPDAEGLPSPPVLPRLPETFWAERPVLAHIRQAAHNRNRAADAVLYGVLARIAAFRPPLAAIDTGIGAPASLNLLVAFCDPSGGGKSSPEKIARRLLPAPTDQEGVDGLPLGSGEGLAEAYMGMVDQLDERTGKTEKVRAQTGHNAFFYADEGQVLTGLNARNGATIMESLRRAFGGELLGQTNASRDRSRRVRNYSLGFIAGLQPTAALNLLREAELGTPQRFVWVSVIDPSVPDDPPPWPGELNLPTGYQPNQPMTIDPDVCAEIRRDDTARIRGKLRRDPLDAHEPLIRIKLAGLLALLDGRWNVTKEDWRLAETMWEVSCGVRDTIAEYGRALAKAERRRQTRDHVARTVAADRALKREEDEVDRVARVMARAARRAAEPLSARDLRKTTASRDRRFASRAFNHALRAGWICETEAGMYVAGTEEP